jgi:hypothetical protein
MRKGLHHYISVWLGSVMLVVVLTLAVLLVFTDMWNDRMYGGKRIFMIVLLLAYAVYRGFRIYRLAKEGNGQNPE